MPEQGHFAAEFNSRESREKVRVPLACFKKQGKSLSSGVPHRKLGGGTGGKTKGPGKSRRRKGQAAMGQSAFAPAA